MEAKRVTKNRSVQNKGCECFELSSGLCSQQSEGRVMYIAEHFPAERRSSPGATPARSALSLYTVHTTLFVTSKQDA